MTLATFRLLSKYRDLRSQARSGPLVGVEELECLPQRLDIRPRYGTARMK
jgi:hypothetical protein